MDCWLIGTLVIAGLSLLFPLWIRSVTRRTARNVLNQLRGMYGRPHVNRPVDPRAFPEADLAFYAASQSWLEQAGFRLLADIENVTANEVARSGPKPGATMPTFQRVLVGDNETVLAVIYHTRVDVPAAAGQGPGKKDVRVVEFGSHFDDGTALYTQPWTTAVQMDPIPGDRRAVLPSDATIDQLLSAHRAGIAQVLSTWKTARLNSTSSVEEFIALLEKSHARRMQHRREIGWVSEAELVRMAGEGKEAIGKSIYREIQQILKKEAAGPQR